MADKQHWTEYRHPYYQNHLLKWKTARDQYEADFQVLRKNYLIQRKQGESTDQFDERKENADYMPLFGLVADSMVGRVMSVEPRIDRIWQREDREEGLGNPSDTDTTAGRLWLNADGSGDNYLTVIDDGAVMLVTMHEIWCLVDGIPRDQNGQASGEASIRLIDPISVVNWRSVGGRPVEVVVKDKIDARGSIRDEPRMISRYKVYDLEGYQDFMQDEEGNMQPEKKQAYGATFYATNEQRRPILPIFRVRLPLRRHVGYIWAEKNKIIFNKESERDNILTVANTPRLDLAATKDQYREQIKPIIKEGGNILLSDPEKRGHSYIAPPTASAELGTKVLEQKIKTFFLAAFRSYENAVRGRERTATEVEHQQAMGEESFLNRLATALDELERGIGKRLEQIYFPKRPELWGQFYVERPKDFDPIDAEEEADRLMERFYGRSGTPVRTEDAEVEVNRRWYEARSLTYDEEQVRSEVQRRRRQNRQEEAARQQILGDGI